MRRRWWILVWGTGIAFLFIVGFLLALRGRRPGRDLVAAAPASAAVPRSGLDAGDDGVAPAATGGPDDFGTVYTDSRAAPGLYRWVDISTMGGPLPFADGNDATIAVSLPQTMTFYGEDATMLYVAANGVASLEETDTITGCDAATRTPPQALAAFCADLTVGNRVYTATTTYNGHESVIVQYDAVTHTATGLTATFQIILDLEDDTVTYQYLDVPDSTGVTKTIGVNGYAQNREDVLTYCSGADGCPPADAMAVRFAVPERPVLGLTLTPSNHFAEVGDTITYTLVISNAGGGAAIGAVMSDTLPTGLDYVADSAGATAGAVTAPGAGGVLRWDGDLLPRDRVTVTYAAARSVETPVYNTAMVTHPLALAAAGATSSPADLWSEPEPIDTPQYFQSGGFGRRFVAVDATGTSHIAYAGDRLYYAVVSGTTWMPMTVPVTPTYGTEAVLLVDDADVPHIAFKTSSFGQAQVWVAHAMTASNASTWTLDLVTTLDSTYSWLVGDLNLERASDGTFHLTFVNDEALYHTTSSAGGWLAPTEVITDGACSLQLGSSFAGYDLVLDAGDVPHVACASNAGSPKSLRFYTAGPTAPWTTYDEIESHASQYSYPSARYAGGAPHVVAFRGNHDLIHAVADGGWSVELVEHISELALQTQAVLDVGGGELGVVYGKRAVGSPFTTTVRTASRSVSGGSWMTSVVTTTAYQVNRLSGAMSDAGVPRVALYASSRDLLQSGDESEAFVLRTVAESRTIGDAAVAVAADGSTHIPYLSNGLRYARRLSTTTSWERMQIDSDADTSWDAMVDAALDVSGTLHAGYLGAGKDLRHAQIADGMATVHVVDHPTDISDGGASVDADGPGEVHMAYAAEVGADWVLRHAALNGTTWTTETLATLGPTSLFWGVMPRLVAQDGKVYVLYLDCMGYQSSVDYPIDLKLATWDGSWSTESVYGFEGQCDADVAINLVGDGAGSVVALADIASDGVRPNPLHLEHWVAGGDGGTHITPGRAGETPVGRAAMGRAGMTSAPAVTMVRGDGLEMLTACSARGKYATYTDDGYSSGAVTVGTVAGSTDIKDGSRVSGAASVVEHAYGDQPGLYHEYITTGGGACCLRTTVSPPQAAADGATATPPQTSGPCGSQAQVTAKEPEEGWRFVNWSGAASGPNKSTMGMVNGRIPNCSVATANFEPIPEASGTKTANPAAPNGVYPGDRISYTLNMSWKDPINDALIHVTDPYPWQRATFLGYTLTWGDYIAQCTDDAQKHTVTCNGMFPESDEGVSTWVRFSMEATCGLYEHPGPVTNQPTIQVSTYKFQPQAQTAVKVPFELKLSSPAFVPTEAFVASGERPDSTMLLYTVPKGDEPDCCTACNLDLYVVVDGDMDGAIKMSNDGSGRTDRTKADFNANDCHHSAWFKPTENKAYQLQLYVVGRGGKVEDGHLAETVTVEPDTRPDLLVLTDLRELYNEFHRVTPNSNTTDPDGDCIKSYYEAVARVFAYAAAHDGIVVDVRQDAYYADLDYSTKPQRDSMYLTIDWLISRMPNTDLEDIAVIGDDAVLPFHRYPDPKANDESRYRSGDSHNVPALIDTHGNVILTDVPYSVHSLNNEKAPKPDFNLGRIFADTPVDLVLMIDGYETDLSVASRLGSAFTFSLANERTAAGVVDFDWQGNTRACAIDPLSDAGYNIGTTSLNDLGLVRRRGWRDAEAGDQWEATDVAKALNSGNGNRLTIINSHATHIYQTTSHATKTLQTPAIVALGRFPGSLVVDIGCHAGYSTGYDASASWNYYWKGLGHAALDRHMTWVASTTFGKTTAGPNMRFHDRVHEQFLRQVLGRAETVGDARRLAIRSYTTHHRPADFENRDIIGVYGTALYGLPTQEIRRRAVTVAVQRVPGPARSSEAALGATVDVRLAVDSFATTTDADGATWFTVENAEDYTAQGNGPVVPLLMRRVTLPAGADGVQVTLVASTTQPYPGTVSLPLQKAGDKTHGVETVPYTGTATYPEHVYWTTVFTDDGATEVIISAVPVRYDPTTGQVTLITALDFTVTYDAPAADLAITELVVDGDQVVQGRQSAVELQATVTTSGGGTYELDWWVEDAAGHPLSGGGDTVTLAAGTDALAWTVDGSGWSDGAKVLHVTLSDADAQVAGAGAQDFDVVSDSTCYLPLVVRGQ